MNSCQVLKCIVTVLTLPSWIWSYKCWDIFVSVLTFSIYRVIENDCWVLTTCDTQYIWDKSMCIFLSDRTTLQVFVINLTGKPDPWCNPIERNHVGLHLENKVARVWFVPSVPGSLREKEEHEPDPWRNSIERNHMGLHLENEVVRWVAEDHHRSHARSIAAVNTGLKIL